MEEHGFGSIGELLRSKWGRSYNNQLPAQDTIDLLPSVDGMFDGDVVLVLGSGGQEGVQEASLVERFEISFGAEEHGVAHPHLVPRVRPPTTGGESTDED